MFLLYFQFGVDKKRKDPSFKTLRLSLKKISGFFKCSRTAKLSTKSNLLSSKSNLSFSKSKSLISREKYIIPLLSNSFFKN